MTRRLGERQKGRKASYESRSSYERRRLLGLAIKLMMLGMLFALWKTGLILKNFSNISPSETGVINAPASNKQISTGEPVTEPPQSVSTTEKQRHKMHLCNWWAHMGRPAAILKDEFGYNTTVDATKDEDWDLIFGGYPHCGNRPGTRRKNKNWDWKMEHYLNQHLNEKRWDTLKPHQVWFPCMGCKDSYCNKQGLCEITRTFDPDSCYLLPDDLDRLQTKMLSSKDSLWVLKQDSPTMHAHMGSGVSFIRNASQIPPAEELASGTYLVQPFVEQWMGNAEYHRRQEIRLYIAVTSTTPLRAYAYNEPWVGLALKVFDPPSSTEASPDVCMLDTHIHRKGCQGDGLTADERSPSFEEFCKLYDLTTAQADRFLQSAQTLIAKILTNANPRISSHPVNDGITKSHASCFSFMRADLTVASNGEAYVYEINEFPFSNEKGIVANRVQGQAYRDLFAMIGLDQPALPADKRANFELSHLGGWIPLYATA